MWSKIYYALLALAVLACGFFVFYSHSWLGSIGAPAAAVEGYQFHAGLGSATLWAAFVILLIVANVILWTTVRAWAMWTTLLFFSAFCLIHYFWLDVAYRGFVDSHSRAPGGISFRPLIGVVMVFVAAAIVYFNSYLNVRLRERMHPETLALSEESGADIEEVPLAGGDDSPTNTE